MRLIVIFVTLCIVRKSIQKLELYEEKVAPIKQLSCVKTAIRKYVADDSSVLVFSKNPDNIVNGLFKVPIFVITEWNPRTMIIFEGKGAMVIFLKGNTDQDFRSLGSLRGSIMAKPVLIVCITDAICASDTYKKEIIETVASAEIHYVAIDEKGIVDMYEYTTTGEGNCGKAEFSRCGHCTDESTAKMVFRKALNFQQCPIRVITRFCPPYSEPCEPDDSHQLCGIEGNVVKDIAKAVNATLEVLRVQNRGDIKELVAKRYGDLGFGQLAVGPHEGVSHTIAYIFTKATVMAPASTWASNESLKSISVPLKIEVWMGIGVVMVFFLILHILIRNFRGIHILHLLGIFIGVPVLRPPRALPSRIYFISVAVFGYLCSQVYLSNLTKVLATSEQQMIKTLDDLEKSDLLVSGPYETRDVFQDYPRIYKDYQGLDFTDYYQKLKNLWIGRYSSALYVEGSDANFAGWKPLEHLEDIMWNSMVMVTPNSSTIMKTTNKLLFSIIESGILNEYVTIQSIWDQFSRHRASAFEQKLVLQLDDLQGVFLLLVTGLSLSSLVFVIEFLTAFIKNKGWLERRGVIRQKLLGQRSLNRILRQRKFSPSRRN